MTVLALDIGGANLKVADGNGFARTEPFSLWKYPANLAGAIQQLITGAPPAERFAVTMTGELADCFTSKVEGVCHILDAIDAIAENRPVQVYLCNGNLVDTTTARHEPLLAAASNWHALAMFASRFLQSRSGLLIDVGSTTTDLILIDPKGPTTCATTDLERLANGELLYTGATRSPICALVRELPWRGQSIPIAQELFSTTLDVYLTTGEIPENSNNFQTADGRPATLTAARDRLARCVCTDRTMFSHDDALKAARVVRQQQVHLLANTISKLFFRPNDCPQDVILSGSGEFLVRAALTELSQSPSLISLSERVGLISSTCAAAHALAVLADAKHGQ
jgi:probable H4MPT-linked C1 transfer pathway protein